MPSPNSQPLWERWQKTENNHQVQGALPALRRGRGRQAGEVPEMLPFYSTLNEDGRLDPLLRAEHVCLTLFGTHQQGKQFSVHDVDKSLGTALNDLRQAERFSDDALDDQVLRLLTASNLEEIGRHLFGLITRMSATKQPIGFNYTQLMWDLFDIQDELKAPRVRRKWGAAYFHHPKPDQETREETPNA